MRISNDVKFRRFIVDDYYFFVMIIVMYKLQEEVCIKLFILMFRMDIIQKNIKELVNGKIFGVV